MQVYKCKSTFNHLPSGVRGELGMRSAKLTALGVLIMVEVIASLMLKLGPKKVLSPVALCGPAETASGVLRNDGERLSGGVRLLLLTIAEVAAAASAAKCCLRCCRLRYELTNAAVMLGDS